MTERVALVTSGAKGLGYVTVRTLLEAGWNVFFTYRSSESEARDLVCLAKQLGRQAGFIQADLLSKNDVLGAVAACKKKFSHVDALIHNFGPFVFERVPLAEYTDDMWTRMMDGNLTNFIWLYQALADGMRKRGFGRIITVGYDGAAHAEGWRFRAAYAAAKAGLVAVTRSIAKEERQNGITANMVCPGDIRGANKMMMIRDVGRPEDVLGRPAVGEDVARVISFLCQEASQQVNGTVTEVTGGYDILAYDDGTDIITEGVTFSTGDEVYVYPWQQNGRVTEVTRVKNRNTVYTVVSGEAQQGAFTAYQLKSLGER